MKLVHEYPDDLAFWKLVEWLYSSDSAAPEMKITK